MSPRTTEKPGPRIVAGLILSLAVAKILLQTEGFELFVRKFELHPLTK